MSFILTLFLNQEFHPFASTRRNLEKHDTEEEKEEDKVKHNFLKFRSSKNNITRKEKTRE